MILSKDVSKLYFMTMTISTFSKTSCLRYNPMLAPVSALPPHLHQSELTRQLTRSPVNFREGRRSSDGLVSPVAFQQRLYCDQEPHVSAGGLMPLEQVSQCHY